MIISKKATRLMTFILAFAFVMTGLSYVPKQVQAEEKQPTVKVLGATLRLDNKSGTQSLRLGIEISNASLAKDCGIVIGANTKEVTVGTDVEDGEGKKNHIDMYSIDKEKDKVIYSAVVTGIPVDSFGLDFSVKGYVTALKAATKTETAAVGKSVDGVVEALKEKNPNIDLDKETGELVRRTATGETEPLTKEDMDNVFRIPNISLDLSKAASYVTDGEGVKTTYNYKDNTLDATLPNFQGIIFKNPAENVDDYKYVTITYTSSDQKVATYVFDGKMGNDGKGQTPAGQVDTKSPLEAADEEVTVPYNTGAMYGLKLVRFEWGDAVPDANISIKSVVFSHEAPVKYVPPVDPSVEAPPYYKVDFEQDIVFESGNRATQTVKDGTAEVVFGAFTGLFYVLPKTDEMIKSKYKHVAITYESEGDTGITVYLPKATMDLEDPLAVLGKDDTRTEQSQKLGAGGIARYSLPADADFPLRGIQLFKWNSAAPTVTIKSVIFSEKELSNDEIAEITGGGSTPSNN